MHRGHRPLTRVQNAMPDAFATAAAITFTKQHRFRPPPQSVGGAEMSGLGRRLLSSIREAVTSGIQSLQVSPPPGQAALAAQLAQARSDLNEGRAQEVVDGLEASKEALVLLLSATSATLGSAYDKLSRGSERDKAFRDAVSLFKMTAATPGPAEIVAIVPALKARGKQAQAIKALREVAAEYPADVSVAQLLATELEATGDPDAASAYAELAYRLPAGDVTQQVHYLKRATELDRGDPELQARLGTALLRAETRSCRGGVAGCDP